jgi:hypothetical protein
LEEHGSTVYALAVLPNGDLPADSNLGIIEIFNTL